MNAKKKTYTISELASMLEMSSSAIRFYEDKGLIRPGRSAGNQRIYTAKDRVRLKLILRGKRFGFSLDEIAEMIGMSDAPMGELSQIEKSLLFAEKKIREISERRRDLDLLEEDINALKKTLLERRDNIKFG